MDMENLDGDVVVDKRSAAFICAKSFLGPILLSLFISNVILEPDYFLNWKYFVPLLTSIILLTFILLYSQFYSNNFYTAVILHTLGLSSVFTFGVHLTIAHHYQQNDSETILWQPIGLFLIVFSLFHFGEFQATSIINHQAATIETFLLNHSLEYNLAMIVALLEYFLESWFFPESKFILHPYITYLGLMVCLFGDGLRKLAMFTAGHNFNHIIQTEYQSDHQLIITGIYSIFRHPSYVGWFYWSAGTQLILQNPFSLIGFIVVSWRFFHQRIQFEEITLINFFGPKYLIYKKEVSTGLPWIDGY